MFSEAPELSDVIYGPFKDYDIQAARIAQALRDVARNARRLLDVGCGTGEHAVRLQRNHGVDVGLTGRGLLVATGPSLGDD